MRFVFISAIVLLLLAACSPAVPTAAQVTVTSASRVTVTLTPIATFTVTPTFTPTSTATPLPELPLDTIAAVEFQLPRYTVIGDQLTNLETGMTIPDWHVVPSEDGSDWSYKSDPYTFRDNEAFVEVIPNESMKVTDTGVVDMEGHIYNPETGEMAQKMLPYEGKETAEPLLSMSQQLEIIRQETQKLNYYRLKAVGLESD